MIGAARIPCGTAGDDCSTSPMPSPHFGSFDILFQGDLSIYKRKLKGGSRAISGKHVSGRCNELLETGKAKDKKKLGQASCSYPL